MYLINKRNNCKEKKKEQNKLLCGELTGKEINRSDKVANRPCQNMPGPFISTFTSLYDMQPFHTSACIQKVLEITQFFFFFFFFYILYSFFCVYSIDPSVIFPFSSGFPRKQRKKRHCEKFPQQSRESQICSILSCDILFTSLFER